MVVPSPSWPAKFEPKNDGAGGGGGGGSTGFANHARACLRGTARPVRGSIGLSIAGSTTRENASPRGNGARGAVPGESLGRAGLDPGDQHQPLAVGRLGPAADGKLP